jgi:hypothetical protein
MSQMPLPDVQLEYTPEELLENGAYSEPLIANGVRCHGGFLPDGSYRSPRTIHRTPAIGMVGIQMLRGSSPGLASRRARPMGVLR